MKLKRAYAEKIGEVLPAAKTARYIQIENKIRAIDQDRTRATASVGASKNRKHPTIPEEKT